MTDDFLTIELDGIISSIVAEDDDGAFNATIAKVDPPPSEPAGRLFEYDTTRKPSGTRMPCFRGAMTDVRHGR